MSVFAFSHSDEIEKKISKIISTLTLKEKILLISGDHNGQITHGIEEKGIPQFKLADGPMGVHWWAEKSTTYPASIACAATWDVNLIKKMGYALGNDARRRGVHILLGPGVNIYRSPLCGRNFEYLGEDPYLSAEMAKAYITGLQEIRVAATVKHFALNFQEYNRHEVSSNVDERTLHEIYLPAFKAAIIEAQSGAIMTGYNLVNGLHCSENKYLITSILKEKWGFKGLVMSDWVSVYSTLKAAEAGLDMEMPTAEWFSEEKILPLIQDGTLSEKNIDDKIRRLLRLGFEFGWMESDQTEDSLMTDEETAKVALEVAQKGVVLLKNEDNILPLAKNKIQSIALVGPNSDSLALSGGGSAFNPPTYEISLFDELKSYFANTKVAIKQTKGILLGRELEVAKTSSYLTQDGEPGVLCEYFKTPNCEGKPIYSEITQFVYFNHDDTIPIEEMQDQLYSIRWTGKIRVPQTDIYRFYIKSVDSLYKLWIDDKILFNNTTTGNSGLKIIDKKLETGHDYSIKVEWAKQRAWATFQFGYEIKSNVEKDKNTAYKIAEQSDIVIACVGFNSNTEGEGYDRTFELPENQGQFINELAKRNPNLIVLLNAGGGVEMLSWLNSAKALLHSWYLGQETAKALTSILFGENSPSGKLPISIEKKIEDNSSFQTYHDNGDLNVSLDEGIFTGYRHYDKKKIEPLFPFGFGLSYTTFEYKNFSLNTKQIKENETISISFSIENTGDFDGEEIAQCYISDSACSLERPVKELKKFKKIFLKKKEVQKITFEISIEDLKFYDPNKHDWIYESGEFVIHVGSSSKHIHFSDTFLLI